MDNETVTIRNSIEAGTLTTKWVSNDSGSQWLSVGDGVIACFRKQSVSIERNEIVEGYRFTYWTGCTEDFYSTEKVMIDKCYKELGTFIKMLKTK